MVELYLYSYTAIGDTTISLISCQWVGNKFVLRSAQSVECWTGRHLPFGIVGIILLITLCIMIPLWLLYRFWNARVIERRNSDARLTSPRFAAATNSINQNHNSATQYAFSSPSSSSHSPPAFAPLSPARSSLLALRSHRTSTFSSGIHDTFTLSFNPKNKFYFGIILFRRLILVAMAINIVDDIQRARAMMIAIIAYTLFHITRK